MREELKTWNFDEWADRYDEGVAADSPLYARYGEVLDKVVEIADIFPGKIVLDIGTGTGNLVLRCLARDAAVIALDPSKRMLAKAREKVGDDPRAEFHQVDEPFLHIPYPDAYFDAVVSTYAFHHIPHRLKPASVREMVRVLKPGGGPWGICSSRAGKRKERLCASMSGLRRSISHGSKSSGPYFRS